MLGYLQHYEDFNDLRYIPNHQGKFPHGLKIDIPETNLFYGVDYFQKFMELHTIEGKRHIYFTDIKSELSTDEVIEKIINTREYIILMYCT